MPSLALAPTNNAPAQPAPTPAPVPVSSPNPAPVVPPSSGDSYGSSAVVSGPSSTGNDGYANSAAVASNPDTVPSPPPDAAQAAQFAQPTISADLPVDNANVARKFADISANPLGLSPEEHARVYGKQTTPNQPTPGGFDLAESPAAQKPQDTGSSGFDLSESPLAKQQTPQPTPGGYDLPESKGVTPGGYDLPESVSASTAPPPPAKPPAQILSEQFGNNHQDIMKAGGDDPTINPDLVLNALKYADTQKGIPIPGEVNAATVGGQAIKDIAPWLDPTNANTWAMVGGMIKGVPEFIQGTGNQAKETLENLGQIFIPNANRSRMQILSDQLFNHQITLSQYNDTLGQIRSGMSTGETPAQLPQEKESVAESADVQARAKAEALPSFELGLRQNGEAVSSIWRNALGFEVNSPIGSALRWLGQGSGDMDATPEQQIAALSLPGFPVPVVRARDASTMDDHERLIQLNSLRAQTNINKGLQSGHVSPSLQSFNTAFTQGNTPEHLHEIGYPVRPEYVESGASMVNQALMVPEFAAGGEISAATGLNSVANTAGGYLLRASSQVPKMVGDVASIPFDAASAVLKGSSNLASKYPRILGAGAITGINTALHAIEPSLSLPFHGEMADYYMSKPLGQFLSPPISTGLSAMSNWVGAVPKGIRMLTEPLTQGLDLAGKDMIAEGGNLLSSRASWDAITKKPMSAEELANMPVETSKSGTDYDIFGGRKVVYDTKTITPAGQLPETGKSGLLPSPEETPLTKERAIPPPKKGSTQPPANGQAASVTPPETPIITQSTDLGRQNPVTNAIRRIAPGITHGAVSTYPLAYLSSPDDPEAQGKFMALGMALGSAGAPAALGDVVKNTLFDHLFSRDPSVSRPGIDVAPIKYGTRSDLDNASLAEINRIDPTTGQYAYSNAQKQAFHTARFAMNGAAEIHILPPPLYEREIKAMNDRGVIQNPDVNSRGVTIDPNPSARVTNMDVSKINSYGPPENPQGPPELQQSRILIRGTPASLDAALTHEMSHPFVNRMSIADQDNLFNLITRQNDPNVFTHNYTKGITNYDHLPSEDGVANGTEPYVPELPYMTKEDMKREMITENLSGLFKGDLLTKYSRNPGLIRGGQMVLGNILERMGIDTTTGLSASILGVKPSFGAAVVLDALARESMQKNVHLRTPQGVGGAMARPLDAPIDPVEAANDASVIKGLIKLGYTPELAAAQLAMSKKLTTQNSPNTPKQSSPAEVAKGILVKGRGFTQDEADRHVPSDAKTASEAANNATLSILTERKAKGIPSPEEQTSESQAVVKPFVPSKEWQKVPEHIMLSNPEGSGMELNLDAGGGKLARWDNPPGQETILNKKTGKLQDKAKINGFVHDTLNGEPIETPEIYPDEISPNDLPPNTPPAESKAQHMPAEEPKGSPKSEENPEGKPSVEYHPTGTIRQRSDGTWALHVGMNHEAHSPFVRLFRTDKAAEFARDDLQKKYGTSLMDHVTADRLAKPEVKPPAATPPEAPKSSPKPIPPEATHGGGGSFEEAPEYPGPGTQITSKGVTEHGKRKGKTVMGAPSTPLPQAPVAPPNAPAGGPPVTVPQVAPVLASAAPITAPAAPVEPGTSESQEKEAPQEETPQTQEPVKKPRKPKQEGATPESSSLQKHLREKEGMSPGQAHDTVFKSESGGNRGPKGRGVGLPIGEDKGGHTGAYGYIGDSTPDTGSLHGVGAYPHVQKWGSLIEGYSAGLTEEAGKARGLVHGQEFMVNGVKMRWDDTANKYFTLNGKQHVIPDNYVDVYCYSSDTQVLTRRGWLSFPELLSSDEVATRNPLNKAFEWQVPTHYVNEPYSGRMVHFTSKVLDVLVTPDHCVLLSKKPNDEEWMTSASDLLLTTRRNKHIRIPVTSIWEGEEIIDKCLSTPLIVDGRLCRKKLIVSGDDFCCLMGAYISEGSIGRGGICICQSHHSKGFKPFKELIERIQGFSGYYKDRFHVNGLSLKEYFSQFGNCADKFIPEDVMNSTPGQIRKFLTFYLLGDGCFEGIDEHTFSRIQESKQSRIVSSTVSKRLADQLVELWQKVGYSASLRSQDRGIVDFKGIPVPRRIRYIVTVRRSSGNSFFVKEVPYSGTVHCVTVPNGIIYVRRNGNPVWSGNSPHHAPDKGVSQAEIERQTKIAQERPGYDGIGTVAGENEGGKGSSSGTGGSNPMQGPARPVTVPSAPSAPAPVYNLPEGAQPVTSRSIGAAEEAAIIAATNRTGAASQPGTEAYDTFIQKHMIQNLGEQHLASLPIEDTRVQLQPGGYISGTHFVTDGSDAFHNYLLQGQSPQVMNVLSQAQDAIANKRDIFATYKSAPQVEAGTPTGSQREVAQNKSPAADRAAGLASIQQAGKEIAPSWVGVAPGKHGEPNTVLIGGSSSDKINSNASQIVHAMGPKSPYPSGPIGSPMALEDLKGALWNQNNGWKMDGSSKLTPTPGHNTDIPQESPGFQPYALSKARGDFWNLAAGQGSGAKMSENAKRAPESVAAFEMARANKGFAEGGYSNPLARSLDIAHPPEPVLDSKGNLKIGKDGKPITKTWTQSKLNSPRETLRADNIAAIHDSGGSPYEKIHPGQAEVSKAMKASGTPKSFPSKAGFLPQEFKPSTPEDFIKSRDKTTRAGYLSPLAPEDIKDHKLYVNDQGTVGAAVDPHGDVQHVFNNGGSKGAGADAVVHAIGQGGKTLDAFDNYLPKLYRQFGFQETGRMKFNPDYAPHGWDYAKDDNPDVVFMAHKGYPPGGPEAAIERAKGDKGNWIKNEHTDKYEDDYDAAKQSSRRGAGHVHRGGTEVSGAYGETGRKASYLPAETSLSETGERYRGSAAEGRTIPIGNDQGKAYQTGEGGRGIAETDAERLGAYRQALQEHKGSSDRIDRAFRQGGKPHAIDVAAEESANQIPALRKLAETRGELLPPMDREPDTHGSEHQVWFSDDGKTATKETYYKDDPAHGDRKRFGAVPTLDAADVRDATPHEYLDRIGIQNDMGRKTRVVGVVDQGNGETRIRTEEPTISDAVGHPSMDDISDYMAKRGFQPKEWTSWYNPETKVLASDAQPRNFLKTDHGIYPVDTMLRHADAISTPLTDADKLKKNEQQRSHLEKKQAKLDTNKPEEDMAWEIMASKIHDLEREHERLSESIKSVQENAPRVTKAAFMPGDVIEKNGERERIKSPAVKFPTGEVYEGEHHPDAQDNGIKDGHFAADAVTPGYTTEPTDTHPDGRFVGMKEGWKIGKQSSQLHPDVDPNKGFLNSEDLADYPHPEDRDLTQTPQPVKAAFMPMAGKRGLGYEEAEREGRTLVGPDALPRYEISDRDMRSKNSSGMGMRPGETYKLGDKINHPTLFRDYPDAKNINIKFDPHLRTQGGFNERDGEEGTIKLKEYNDFDTLTHEIQHWIQAKEGWTGRGVSPEDAASRIDISSIRQKAKEEYIKAHPSDANYNDMQNYMSGAAREAMMGAYQEDSGETEARVAMSRRTMTPEERLSSPPEGYSKAQFMPRERKLTKQQMLDEGADGYLNSGYRMSIPISQITGREPVPEMEGGYKKGTPVTQPVEVEHNPDDGTYTLYSGNHRVRQAEINGETHVPAFVEAKTYPKTRGPLPGMSPEESQSKPGSGAHPEDREPTDTVTQGSHGQDVRETSDYDKGTNGSEMVRYREPESADFEATKRESETKVPFDASKATYVPAEKAYFMPSDNSLPVEYAKNKDGSPKLDKKGKPKPVKINFDLSKAPRISNKQPEDRMPEDAPNTMKSFDYLSENQQKQLSYQDKVSATGTLAKRAAVQLKKWMDDPEIAKGKDWYESMRGKLAKAFGDDHEMFSHLLGVTSPMENPHDNFLYALEAYERLQKGDFARHIDLYKKAHNMMKSGDLVNHVEELTGKEITPDKNGDKSDAEAMAQFIHHHDILPERENGKLYSTYGNGILRAISELWADEPGAPKTKNYAGNLLGTTNAATIDSWAARFVRQLGYDGEKQWRIQPKSETGVSDYDFAFAQRVFDKAAKSIGISPDAAQAIVWTGEKKLWEKNGWIKGMGAEASSLDTPFDIAHPEGPAGPRLTAVKTREILAQQRAAAAKVEKEEKVAAKKAAKLGPPIPSMAK